MAIIEDTRNKKDKHELKHLWFLANDVKYYRCALPCGDYALFPKVSVDTKENMAEIANNIGGSAQEHKRFREELKLAKEYGCRLYVLVENDDGIRCLKDVENWENPRLKYSRDAITGQRLCKAMRTMQERYGVTFLFCRPEESAQTINEILGGTHGEE